MKKVIFTALFYFEDVLGVGKQLRFIATQPHDSHLNDIYLSCAQHLWGHANER